MISVRVISPAAAVAASGYETRVGGRIEFRAARPGGLSIGTLHGYAIVHNSPSDLISDRGASKTPFREVVRPGACSRTIREHDIRAMLNHDPAKILGRNRAGTLRLREEARGVGVEIDLPDTSHGRDALTNVSIGNLSGMSFGFRVEPGGERWDLGGPVATRYLTNISIDDVSIVAFPAYPDTVIALRSLERAMGNGRESVAEEHRRNRERLRALMGPSEAEIRAANARDRDRLDAMFEQDRRREDSERLGALYRSQPRSLTPDERWAARRENERDRERMRALGLNC